jgi:hypothetical protein
LLTVLLLSSSLISFLRLNGKREAPGVSYDSRIFTIRRRYAVTPWHLSTKLVVLYLADIDFHEMIELQEDLQKHDEAPYCQIENKDSSINNNLRNQKQRQQRPELRKVQALQGKRSLVFVLPKSMAVELGIEKGDYLSVHVELPRKIVLEKAEV